MTACVVDRVDGGLQAAAPRLGEQARRGLAVELVEHERAGDVERAPRERTVAELLGAERGVRTPHVQEGALAGRVDEGDARRRRKLAILEDARRLDAALVQQIEDELAEGVGADLAERGGAEAEPREAAGGVERAAAAAQLDGVDEAERPRHGQPRHRPDDDVGDEDSEADDVRVRHAGHAWPVLQEHRSGDPRFRFGG